MLRTRPSVRLAPDWVRVAAVALGLAVAFVTVRLLVPAEGDVSRFVVAGSTFVDPAEAPSNLYVFENSDGYDGLFAWRIAADPTHLRTDRHLGVLMDQPLRLQRVGYPYLAWLLSFGNVSLLPWSLVAVNVLALAALAGCGAVLARDAGRSPWLGLVLAAVPGFAFTLSRDLTEIVAAAILVGGILAVRREKWWLAAGLWGWGVLTREQLLVPIAAFGLWRLWSLVRRRSQPAAADATWIVPGVVFVAWQLVILRIDGGAPLLSGTQNNLGPPFVGLIGGMSFWASQLSLGFKELYTNALTFYELAVVVALVVVALRTKVPRDHAWEQWMFVSVLVLALLLTRSPWDSPADLRSMADVSVLAWVVIICWARQRVLMPLIAAQSLALVGAMALRLAAV